MKRIFFVVMLVCIVVMCCGCGYPKIVEFELRQINLGDKISGSFFLASGSIDQSKYFYFYTVSENGCIRLREVHHRKVYIFEGNYTPRAIFKRNSWGEYDYRWIIYLPKNSIVEMINTDLK